MDDKQFDILLLPLKDRMFRLAKSILGGEAEAQDAVQDVYERLWRRRSDLDGSMMSGTYVCSAVRNHCIDRLRSRRIRLDAQEILRNGGGTAWEGAHRIEARDMVRLVERIIAGLPEKQRTAIHLRDVEGCEMAEIARIMDLEEVAVRMNLSRARKAVREKMIQIMEYGT